MTDKEIIYRYLKDKISHQTFRKWLLSSRTLPELFKNDSKVLLDLADKFSKRAKINDILHKYIDKNEFDRYSIGLHLNEKCSPGQDPVDLIKNLNSIRILISDSKLVNQISQLDLATSNMPTLTEKPFWDPNIYESKRIDLKKLTPAIIATYEKVKLYAQTNVGQEKNGT